MESSVASTSFQSAQLSPSLSSTTDSNMINETPQPQYLKLEDLQSAGSPAPLDNSPASVIIHSRPTKKRKSWGQELPEPKTTLPPRKRAKTDDEKEQRRIERIKRNRAAAHNSRERKRQETENLAVLLARARAELDAYRRLHGPLPDDIVLPEVTLSKEEYESQSSPQDSSNNKSSDSPAPSLPSPATTLLDSNISIKSEPSDTVMPLSLFDESETALPALDMTQHSAVSVKSAGAVAAKEEVSEKARLEQLIFEIPAFGSTTSLTSPIMDQGKMVVSALHVSYPSPNSDGLPSDSLESVDHFALSNGALDQTNHSSTLDDSFGNDAFFFDDFIDSDAVSYAAAAEVDISTIGAA